MYIQQGSGFNVKPEPQLIAPQGFPTVANAVPVGSSWKVFRCIVIKPKFVCVVLQGSSYGALNGVIRLKYRHIAVAWLHIIPLKGAREYENCQYVFHYR